MSSEWYVRVNGRVHGPLDDKKLVQLASLGKIQGSTEIARSQTGPWHAARALKGLRFSASTNTTPSPDILQQRSIQGAAQAESQHESAAEHPSTPQANRAVGYGLLFSGAMCLLAGLLIYFFYASVFGVAFRRLAWVIGPGIGMFVAGLLNVLTGKNLADIQLLPDTSKASIGVQVLAAIAKFILAAIILVFMVWIAFTFFIK